MNKLLTLLSDAADTVLDIILGVRRAFWKAVDVYEDGAIQEFFRAKLHFLSWILIGSAMFLISTTAHYIGFDTLKTEFVIFLLLVGVRFAARAGL